MSEATGIDDSQARRRALAPDASFIVQAPAGSGKTELLIQRYLTLLGRVDEPEEVLAITFTNKAAAEMRHRVLLALEEGSCDDPPAAAHAALTWRLARAVLARDAERGWHLQQNTGRLRIQTLDAFNAMLARMQPLTASVSTAGSAIPPDAEMKRLYRDAATATLDYLALDDEWSAHVARVLTHLDCNVSVYIQRLADMLTSRDQWLPLIGGERFTETESSGVRAVLEGDLEAMVNDTLASVRRACPPACLPELLAIGRYASGVLIGAGSDAPITGLHEVDSLPPADWRALGHWQGLAELLLTADGKPRQRLTKNEGFPPGKGEGKAMKQRHADLCESLARTPAFLDGLQAARSLPEPRYSDEQWAVLRSLLDLLKLATAELKRLFRQHGATDYIEISLGAAEALGDDEAPTDLALLLDYRIRHILVDEVQDTSLAQYRMLERLTSGWTGNDGRTLFCVGDPMQSIYRFRNAEVAQFLVARSRGIGSLSLESLTLKRNFRSGDGLVRWFNDTFRRVMPGEDDPQRGAVSYAEAESPDAMRGYGDVQMHPVLGSAPRHEAATSVAVIRQLLLANEDDRVAVLVRSRSQLVELVRELRLAGIRFRAVDIDTLTELPETLDLLALARAAAHAGDRHAWLGVLRAPWIGLTFEDLVALVRGARNTPVPTLLADPVSLDRLSADGRARIERARPALAQLIAPLRFETLRDRVEAIWLRLGGAVWLEDPSLADNVQKFLRVLASVETAGTLADVARFETELASEKVASVIEARVDIMTMHKSKGLQFDHVLLHGLGRDTRGASARVLNWMESMSQDGNERLLLAPVGRSDSEDRDPLHRYLGLLDREKDRFELQRLLYVACTRARKSLHLVGHCGFNEAREELRQPAANTLLALIWPMVEAHFHSAQQRGEPVRNSDSDVEWLLPELRRLPDDWSPPPVEPPVARRVRRGEEGEQRTYEWAGSDAKVAGTLVHRWLQAWTEGRLAAARDDPAMQREITARWLRDGGYVDADNVMRRVLEALRNVLGDERGRWLLDGDGHAELALTGLVDGELHTGVIDRVRIDGDEHWIVDYKTSVHEGANLEYFLEEEQRRYADQVRRYVTLYAAWSGTRPRAALYFPLLSAFVEMQVPL